MPLQKHIKGPLAEGEDRISVKMLLSNVEEISFNLQDKILQEMKGIPIVVNPNQEDILI